MTIFLWGVATAGHQIEGDNTAADTWFAENVEPTVFRERSGTACDGYARWREDVDMVAAMGLNAYRFSVEWARVEPREGEFDAAALGHYAAVADRCRERGLAPIVTFNHMTSPHWFAARGAWLDPAAPGLFARYCDRVMAAFGDRIAAGVTLNEPNLPRLLSWTAIPDSVRDLERATLAAAGAAAGVPRYRLANVMLPEEFDAMADGMAAGHRAARAAVKARRPDLPLGFSLAMVDDQVRGRDDPSVRDRKRAEVYGRWLELAREDDFLGVQNYERQYYDGKARIVPSEVDPRSLGECVRYAHARAGVPILVSEHGINTEDDAKRAAFIEQSLPGLKAAMADGVPVLGYIHWTLMDNFEWMYGYGPKLGLHTVDRETFARRPKPSAAAYAALVRAERAG
ncbi:family 1 glycosylhydrolase [Paractinoplanes rhizophilus]|uniref:Family 1 glycosylhydrolase n=1 Tax=Paractinoplanes rhizophilus TaxID=1416877 RepID=A0ABW2HI24_9ACTN|nr:family 1 glycosylhydrolase [Actinoplanes sp.]